MEREEDRYLAKMHAYVKLKKPRESFSRSIKKGKRKRTREKSRTTKKEKKRGEKKSEEKRKRKETYIYIYIGYRKKFWQNELHEIVATMSIFDGRNELVSTKDQ